MPRPGPRPYECVRRAWHSDRHQPIRGSLIKEIFRVANEIHSSSTKQNKEWQEKLPIVVLKAEEIMYSKANSEAEYMDLKTLWDRTSDAINTIIRRDESTETGEFLQPCIEAALNLGCTPRRASRSQRNCHPRCYLSTNTPDVSPSMVENSGNGSSFVRPSNHLSSDPRSLVAQNNISTAIKFENVPPSNHEKLLAMSNYTATNSSSTYPLYYANFPQFGQLQPGCVNLPPKPVSDVSEPAKGGAVLSPPCHEDASKKNVEPSIREVAEKTCKIGCDLSLRLGPLSAAVPSVENKQSQDVKEVSPQGGGKFCDELPILDKGFPLFPRGNAYEALGSYNSIEATMRKRKAVFDQPVTEDQQFCLPAKLPFSHLTRL